MKMATCHPDRRHYAKALCKACYHRLLQSAPSRRPVGRALRRIPHRAPYAHHAGVCWCGQAFTGTVKRRYCSPRCRRQAAYLRTKGPACRVCGFVVDLLPIPDDCGGGWLCRLCVEEGLRRAA